jgi:phospholipid/cholesterol/gamma-HCH transport system substrate-binding protein
MTREFRLGIFIAATLAILAAGVFLIGSKQLLFARSYQVRAHFQNVSGLSPGADVRIGGIQKGTVKAVDLPRDPGGEVAVAIELRSDTRGVVKQDSVAAIKSEGMLGDKYVEISFGSPGAPQIKDGDTIRSEPPLDISDLFAKANQILDSTQTAVENFNVTASNVASITSKVDRGQGTIGALVNDKTVYKEASASATAMRENMEAFKHNFLVRGFFKKRGYEDEEEIKKHEVPKLPAGPVAKRVTYEGKELFDKADGAKLKNQKALNEVGRFLENQKFGLVVVAASMGMKGDSEKSLVLTQARSSVVRDYLAQNFRLDDSRIKTIGLGKNEDTPEEGRVEILVYPEGGRP